MSRYFLLLNLLVSLSLFSQIRLNDVKIELKKSSDFHQMVTSANLKTKEIISFISDKNKITALKFNNSIFLSDSLSLNKPDDYRFLIGSYFVESNNPISYWANNDLSEFYGISFDFQNKNTTQFKFDLNLKEDQIFSEFSENGKFYFISQKKDSDELFVTILNGNVVEKKRIDFSKINFIDENKPNSLNKLLKKYGLTKIEEKGYNSLFTTSKKIKFYLKNDTIIITFDNTTSSTMVLEVNLLNSEIKETKYKIAFEENFNTTNSLLFENKLVQLKANKSEFKVDVFDFENNNLLKTFQIKAENEESTFGNDFYSQTGDNRPKKIKSAKKFLRRISFENLGASIYNYKNTYISTIGSIRETLSNGDVLVGVLGLATIAAGYDTGLVGLTDDYTIQSNAFDVTFNADFEIINSDSEPLFIDKISRVISENKYCKLDHYFHYKGYFILSYYDSKNKEVVLVKCTDGFD